LAPTRGQRELGQLNQGGEVVVLLFLLSILTTSAPECVWGCTTLATD